MSSNSKSRNNGSGSHGRGRGRGRVHGGRRGGHCSGMEHQHQLGDSNRGSNDIRDNRNLKCFNCDLYGHFASECRKPRHEKNQEVNLVQVEDNEPALLLSVCANDSKMVLLNEENVIPHLGFNCKFIETKCSI